MQKGLRWLAQPLTNIQEHWKFRWFRENFQNWQIQLIWKIWQGKDWGKLRKFTFLGVNRRMSPECSLCLPTWNHLWIIFCIYWRLVMSFYHHEQILSQPIPGIDSSHLATGWVKMDMLVKIPQAQNANFFIKKNTSNVRAEWQWKMLVKIPQTQGLCDKISTSGAEWIWKFWEEKPRGWVKMAILANIPETLTSWSWHCLWLFTSC